MMRLSQSHDPSREFSRITQVQSSLFFCLLFKRLLWSHDSGHEFGRITLVDLGNFFLFF